MEFVSQPLLIDYTPTFSENREQLAAAGVLDSLSYSAKMPIPSNRPHLQRSQSHHSSPPSPSPHGHHPSGFLPPLNHDRFGTSPRGSKSIGPASSKYFGTSSPSSFHRPSPSGFASFGPSSYENPHHPHHPQYPRGSPITHSPLHQRHHSERERDPPHHEMSSSLPSHFHTYQPQTRSGPVRWEPQPSNNNNNGSVSPKSEPMDTTMSLSLPSLPSLGSYPSSHPSSSPAQPVLSYTHHASNGNSNSNSNSNSGTPPPQSPSHPHHRHQHSYDFGRSPLSTSSPSNGHGYDYHPSSPSTHGHHGHGGHHASHSYSHGRESSPGPFSQSFPSNYHHHQAHPSSQHHHYSSSPSSSSSYFPSSPSQGAHHSFYNSSGPSAPEDRRFHSAPIPVRHRS